MAQNISNQDDVIDSRNVIARIEELENERDGFTCSIESCKIQGDTDGLLKAVQEFEEWDSEYGSELCLLMELAEEAEQYASDWKYGATLIRDSYFADYARELLEDTGTLPKDLPWYVVVDWEATAKHIRGDYTRVDFDGVDYWIR